MSCLSSGPGGDASALVLNALISRTRNLESTCGATTNNGTLTVKGILTAESGIIVNGDLVTDSLVNNGDLVSTTLTATNGINGVLLTAAQPNITSVGTLNGITTPNWNVDTAGNTVQQGSAVIGTNLYVEGTGKIEGSVTIEPAVGSPAITVGIKANTTITGTVTQTGNATRNGILTQNGNTTLTGTLTHTGNTNNTGTLTQTGNISCSGSTTTASLAASGNVSCNTLTVSPFTTWDPTTAGFTSPSGYYILPGNFQFVWARTVVSSTLTPLVFPNGGFTTLLGAVACRFNNISNGGYGACRIEGLTNTTITVDPNMGSSTKDMCTYIAWGLKT